MNSTSMPQIIMIPEQELKQIKETQGKILEKLESLQTIINTHLILLQ